MSAEETRALEKLLDAAGREVQPKHPGWRGLPQGFAGVRQGPPRHGLWWRAPPLAMAAAAGLFFVLWQGDVGTGPTAAKAGQLPIEVQRQDVELTVLSIAET